MVDSAAVPLEALPLPTLRCDGAGRLVDVNEAALALFGLDRETFLSRRVDDPMEVLTEDLQPLATADWVLVRTLGDGIPRNAVVLVRFADGELHRLEVHASPVEGGGVLALLDDRTETWELRRLLQARTRIYEVAAEGNLEDVLRRTLDEAEVLTGSRIGFYHFVEPDQRTLSLQAWSTATEATYCKAEGKGQHYAIDQAGVWVDAVRQGHPVIHNDYASLPHRKGLPEGHAALTRELVVTVHRGGRIVAILGVGNKPLPYTERDARQVQDLADLAWEIAEHKRAEQLLRLRDEALQQSLNAFVLMDTEGRLRHVNPAFLSLWGFQRTEEVLGRDRLTFWAAPEQAGELLHQALATGRAQGELEALRRDGSRFLAEVRMTPVKDPSGRLMAFLGNATDITDRRRAEIELQARTEALEGFFHATPDPLLLADTQGRILRVNEAWTRLMGYTTAELEGRTFLDLVHPDDITATLGEMARLNLGEPVIDFVNRYIAKDGTWHSLEWRANGRDSIIYAGARDITQRLSEEAARQQAERRLALVLEGTGAGTWDWNLETGAVTFSPRWATMLGYTLEELAPTGLHTWEALCHPEDLLRANAAVGAHLEGHSERYVCTVRMRAKDGHWRWILDQGVVVARSPEGRPLRFTGYHLDIHEAKEAEARLRALNDRLALVSEAMAQSPLSIVITDAEGTIEYVNPAFEAITGYRAEEALGQNPRILASGSQDRAFYQAMWTTLRQGGTWEGRFHNRRKDGSFFWEQARINPVRDNRGEVRHYLALKEDITEALRLAEERTRLEAMLFQSQKPESLGSLASGIAHDMNNVLAAILGLATALRSTEAPGSPRLKPLELITSAAEKGGRMVRGLLDFARQGGGERRPMDLNALVREEVALLERTTLGQVAVAMELTEPLPLILGDPAALSHTLMNLCVNAVDAMPEGGRLTLRTLCPEPGWVQLQVVDEGCGMTPEVLAKALDPYFTTKPEGKGTGLGLAMAYGTLKAHGGHLELASEAGRGTTVTLRLPRAEVPAEPTPSMPSPEVVPTHRRSVLLVDDDELVRTATEAMLALEACEVVTASSGEAALAALEGGFEPQVVILDMNMPGLGGGPTLARLRQLRPDLPVFLATGRADRQAQALVDAHPGVTLLPKPYGLPELQRALGKLEA